MQQRGSSPFLNKFTLLIVISVISYLQLWVHVFNWDNVGTIRKRTLGLRPHWYNQDDATSIVGSKILHTLPMDGNMTCFEDAPDKPTCTLTKTCWTPKMPRNFYTGNFTAEGHMYSMDRVLRYIGEGQQVTSDMQSLKDLESQHNLAIIQLTGTTIVSMAFQYHIPHFVEALLPLINTLSQKKRFGVSPPYRVMIGAYQFWQGDTGFQLNLTDIVLSAIEENELASSYEKDWLRLLGWKGDLPMETEWFTKELGIHNWMIDERLSHLQNTTDYIVCFDQLTIPSYSWYGTPFSSILFRRYLYDFLAMQPIAYGESNDAALSNLQNITKDFKLLQPCERTSAIESQPGEIVMVQRKSTRGIANFDEVVNFVFDVTGIRPRVVNDFEGTVFNQASQVLNSRILISPHGAGLTNIIFMPVGSAVIEILPLGYDVSYYFKWLTTSSSLRHHQYINQNNDDTVMTDSCITLFNGFNKSIQACGEDGGCFHCMKSAKTRIDLQLFRPLLEAAISQTAHLHRVPCSA